jgi:hypothetical protein
MALLDDEMRITAHYHLSMFPAVLDLTENERAQFDILTKHRPVLCSKMQYCCEIGLQLNQDLSRGV